MNNTIHSFKRWASLAIFSFAALISVNAQNKIEGVVRDAHTQLPINAAQVSISSLKVSVITDEEGKFTLELTPADQVLHVTAFDYNKVEVPVRAKNYVVVDMYPETFTNYFTDILLPTGKVNRSSLNVSLNNKSDIDRLTEITADQVVQNSLGADVRAITHSGMVGSGKSIFIRGLNSLNANVQPLYIVDGVMWNKNDFQSIHQGSFINPLENIDVNDIDNITVLKDGTSIYGSRAANGVIIINTKRATSPVTKIGLNVFYGISETPTQTPMMTGDEYRIFASDLIKTAPETSAVKQNQSFLGSPTDKRNSAYYNNTNWADEVYQFGNTSNYLINVDGGDDRAMYYFSVGYSMAEGNVKTTNMNRLNARFNLDANLAKFMTMGVNMAYTRTEKNLLDDGIDYYSSPTWQAQIKSPFLSPMAYTSSGEQTQRYASTDEFGIANPAGIIEYSQNKQKKYKFNIGVNPVATIIPGLTIGNQFDYTLDKIDEAYFLPMNYSPERYIENKGISKNRLQSQILNYMTIYDDTRVTYETMFGTDHSLKAMIGFRYQMSRYEMDYIEEHNSGSNTNTMITGSYEFKNTAGVSNISKMITNYANVDYDYKNKYFVTATMAMDASSKFGRNTQGGIKLGGVSWGLFPSINGAWLFSSEEFMQGADFINFGKLRLGYGVTGNDDIPDYESLTYLTAVRYLDVANGLILSSYENDQIQWEQTQRASAGIDLGLFKNRLSVGFDVYASKTNNLLTQKNLPEILGTGLYWTNGGSLENKGFELALDAKLINVRDFQWSLGLSVGHYKNKITALDNKNEYFTTTVYGGEVITQVGSAAGLFYGYKTNGVLTSEADAIAANLKQSAGLSGGYDFFEAGDVHFVDLTNDGIIDENDKQVIGDPNPDLYGTFNTTLSFKRFKLDALFTYSYGNDVYNYYRSMLESGSDFSNQSSAMLNRWMVDGQETAMPKAVYGDPMGNSRFSDRWIEDGSYLKFKKLMLSYQLPIKNDFIRGISVWASVNDLFTLTNYLGRDPEFSVGNSVLVQGVDVGYLPQTRSYYLGFRIDL